MVEIREKEREREGGGREREGGEREREIVDCVGGWRGGR